MKAAVYTRYGGPEVVRLTDIPKPVPGKNELLVKVKASTVNRTDCGFRAPNPFFIRFFNGFIKPKRAVLGTEFAGVVEETGSDVKNFKPGDRVFGLTGVVFGAHAEYICINEEAFIAQMPDSISFEEAASVCDGSMLALTVIKDIDFSKRPKILINGTTGSIGSTVLQLCNYYDAEITAVCNTKNIDLVKSLGAGRVIDYLKEDFTKDNDKYDIVIDAVGKSSFFKCRGLLKENGMFISTDLGFMYQNIFLILVSRWWKKKVLLPIPKENNKQILFIREMLESGKIKPIIDRYCTLDNIAEAYRYVDTEEKTGNVVVVIE